MTDHMEPAPLTPPDTVENEDLKAAQADPFESLRPSFTQNREVLSQFKVPGYPDSDIAYYEILVSARYSPDQVSTIPWRRLGKDEVYSIRIPPKPVGGNTLLDVSFFLVAYNTRGRRSKDVTGERPLP